MHILKRAVQSASERKEAMKCSRCGADLKDKDICGKCGKKFDSGPEIEIEYKDFKVSEYLEIRKREHKTSSETGAVVHGDEQPIAGRDYREVTVPDERTPSEADRIGTKPGPRSPEGKKSSSLAVVIILLLLAAFAGLLYLWRLLAR
jgi:DNA-directed RNA polymerase subunit RPC12/RpoP